MSAFIKPKDNIETERVHLRLSEPVAADLRSYAKFTNSDEHYVANAILEKVFGMDRDFLAWKTKQPVSYAVEESAQKVREKLRQKSTNSATATA